MMNADNIPLSLYIHTPWCVRKCPYCDFNSHVHNGQIPEQDYVNALIADLRDKLKWVQGRPIDSIFIGGGTPSLMSPWFYQTLFNAIRNLTELSCQCEITMEANPGTVEQRYFQGYREAGINRISIGVQSFCSEQLHNLGRIHSADEALKAIETARIAGFDNINLDIMFGLPEQTHQNKNPSNCNTISPGSASKLLEQAINTGINDLKTAIELKPTHLSWYQLTLEPNTLFHKFPPKLPTHDAIADLHQAGVKILHEHGYQQYEISAYAQNKRQCQHNLNYWSFGDYIGIGAGAHGKMTDFTTQKITRQWNYKNPKDYLNNEKTFVANEFIIPNNQLAFEFMLNHLRLFKPVDFSLFAQRTGLKKTVLLDSLTKAKQLELITQTENGFSTTAHGKLFLNDLTELFLS